MAYAGRASFGVVPNPEKMRVPAWVYWVVGAAAAGLAAYFYFGKKSEREQILEKAREAKKEKASEVIEPDGKGA